MSRKQKQIEWVVKENGCWECTSHFKRNGYPVVQRRGKGKAAVGISHIMLNEKEPKLEKDLCALHTCNNKACINPDHLYWGTQFQNVCDAILFGDREIKKFELRKRISEEKDQTVSQVAHKYNVTKAFVRKVKEGGLWQELFDIKVYPLEDKGKVTLEDIIEIKKWTHSLSWWAKKLDVDQSYISYIRAGKRLCNIAS